MSVQSVHPSHNKVGEYSHSSRSSADRVEARHNLGETSCMHKRHASAVLLFAETERRGFVPRWEEGSGMFSFTHEGRTLFVHHTLLLGNSQLGSWICQDKRLTRAFLDRLGHPGIPWLATRDSATAEAFLREHGRVIQKPALGMKTQGVRLVARREELDRTVLSESILERYVQGDEWRCLVLDGTVIGMQRKILQPTETHPWRTHIENLAETERRADLSAIALALAQELHMRFLAADFLIGPSRHPCILELNGMPGLHSWHHPDAGEPVDVAAVLLDAIVSTEKN